MDSVCRSRVGSPLTSMNCVPWVTGSKAITNSLGNCTDNTALPPGGRSIEVDGEFGETVAQCIRQVDARAPEYLAIIFDFGERIGVMGADMANPRADGECDLDHFVEGGLVARGAQPAIIFVAIDGFERRPGVEHAAATGTNNVPGQFKQTEPGSVQKRGDDAFLVEAMLRREVEYINAAQIAVGRIPDRGFDGGNAFGVGRLPQRAEKSFGFAHRL